MEIQSDAIWSEHRSFDIHENDESSIEAIEGEGIRIVAYLDDILIISKSMETSDREYEEDEPMVGETGIYCELQEVHVMPITEDMCSWGRLIDTCEMTLSVPQEEVKVQREARQILRKDNWSARKLAATIGIMNSVCKAMSPGCS